MSTPQYNRAERRAIAELLSHLENEESRLSDLSAFGGADVVEVYITDNQGDEKPYALTIDELRLVFRRRMDDITGKLKSWNIHVADGLPAPSVVSVDTTEPEL